MTTEPLSTIERLAKHYDELLEGKWTPSRAENVIFENCRFIDGACGPPAIVCGLIDDPAPKPKPKRRIEYERYFPDIR